MTRTHMPRSLCAGISLLLPVALGAPPAGAGQGRVTLPGARAYPESVTATADGTLYAGSVANGGIYRATPGAAAAHIWIKPGAFGTRSIFGVLADEKTGTLWACSNDFSRAGVPGPGHAKGSWLKGFDLKTGAGKISARFPGTHNFCNDIAVDDKGDVYVTNSWKPEILKLDPATATLKVWIADPRFKPPEGGVGLDGLAFAADGDLYADTFSMAQLFRIDIENGKPGAVTPEVPSRPLELADALRPLGGDAFLLVEGAGRLDSVTFDGNDATVETLKSGLDGPTGVTRTRGTAWVAEGQLRHLFGRDSTPALPFDLTAVPLSPPQP